MKYNKLSKPVMPKPQRQPNCTTASATKGTPITFANLAAASKIAVAIARSLRGNQYPVAFELAGKPGASANPSTTRAARMPPNPPANAVAADVQDTRNAVT